MKKDDIIGILAMLSILAALVALLVFIAVVAYYASAALGSWAGILLIGTIGFVALVFFIIVATESRREDKGEE
jgi:hypothetical protein